MSAAYNAAKRSCAIFSIWIVRPVRLTQFETVFEPTSLVEVVGVCGGEETVQPRRFAAVGVGLESEL